MIEQRNMALYGNLSADEKAAKAEEFAKAQDNFALGPVHIDRERMGSAKPTSRRNVMIELPPPDVHDLSGTAFVGWSASAMRSYAQAAVLAERAAERERCAKLCEAIHQREYEAQTKWPTTDDIKHFALECAAAIRAQEG